MIKPLDITFDVVLTLYGYSPDKTIRFVSEYQM
jgi:hypothetical protein